VGFAAVAEVNGSLAPKGSEVEDALLKKSESLKGSPLEEAAKPLRAGPF